MKIKYDIVQLMGRQNLTLDELIEIRKMNLKHEPEISVMENIYSKEILVAEPKQVIDDIRNGAYKEEILQIRQTKDSVKKRELKQRLPVISFGATFNNNNRKDVKEASNLICLDFDHVDNLEKKLKRLRWYYCIYAMFLSPSGDGLKLIIRTDVEDDISYKKAAGQLINEFAKIGLVADPSKLNINDLCFFSYDPKAYYNPQANIWKHVSFDNIWDYSADFNQIKKCVENIISQIEERKLDITSDYNHWISIGFALIDQFGDSGRDYFHRISQFHPEYEIEKCNKQFNYCLKSNRSGITIKTFFFLAGENGIRISQESSTYTIKPDPFDQEFYTGEELLIRSIDQLPVLVDPILPKVGLVALGGTSDVGKSSFLRQLAINISSGQDKFLSFQIIATHRRVLYVSTEDDDSAIAYLLKKQNEFLIKPSTSFRNLIFTFDTASLLQKVEKMISVTPVDLIIIDTFSDFYGGDMNQTNKIRSFSILITC